MRKLIIILLIASSTTTIANQKESSSSEFQVIMNEILHFQKSTRERTTEPEEGCEVPIDPRNNGNKSRSRPVEEEGTGGAPCGGQN